jgi:multiple sugar transport system permease protein
MTLTTSTPATAAAATAPVRGVRRRGGGGPAATRRRTALVAYLFALPFILSFAVFMLFPLASSLVMSLTDFRSTDIQSPFEVGFVGFEQFQDLFQNQQFVRSLGNTAYFVAVGIPLTMAVALGLAVALNNGIQRFRVVFRVGFYAPVVTSIVAVAVVSIRPLG